MADFGPSNEKPLAFGEPAAALLAKRAEGNSFAVGPDATIVAFERVRFRHKSEARRHPLYGRGGKAEVTRTSSNCCD